MFIDKITLNNFRAYKGENTVSFLRNGKNVFLIAGNNGFGKTTFMTSLVWCLYGKLMGDVDEKFRRDLNDASGYKNYAKAILSQECWSELKNKGLSNISKKNISKKEFEHALDHLSSLSNFYVEIHISDVFIPSIPCSEISIRRTYDVLQETEDIDVLIDGQVNELAKEVGYDIFINDFILSKDIAKFFLFDAEKIVNLAEIKSVEEKRKLSTAYSEVLGIKKYEDIKKNLENLRLKFRRKGGTSVSKSKLTRLTNEIETIEKEIENQNQERLSVIDGIERLRAEKDTLQEKLIREGNAISIEELANLKVVLASLKEKDTQLKSQLRDMLDLAPFAISGKLFCDAMTQSTLEQKSRTNIANSESLIAAMQATHKSIIGSSVSLKLNLKQKRLLENILKKAFSQTLDQYARIEKQSKVRPLLDFTTQEHNAFRSLFDNIRYSYSSSFKQLIKDIKNNGLFLQKTQRKITAAEYDDGNAEIKDIRSRKEVVEKQLVVLDESCRSFSEKLGILNRDLSVKKKQLSEYLKLVRVDDMDKEKDIIAERLINELNAFLSLLREKRKTSLESKIKAEIDVLMHKTNFIYGVSMDILENIIEINLLDKDGQIINKEKLSKGEQQLYATAILKALVDESGISFPVFIDSPLQKFDSIHSKNIISKFYPAISKQVVIFPLLGKELSPSEYDSLLPHVNSAYVIQNKNGRSSFLPVNPNNIFEFV